MDDDELELADLVELAEEAEMVRGQHFTAWWGEVERLERDQQWSEYEALLGEMRDATERGAQIAGYTLAPAPALALAWLYESRGEAGQAVAELERFVAAVDRFRKHEPTGGDTGHRRAREALARLRAQNHG